jgi:hypothetical protein
MYDFTSAWAQTYTFDKRYLYIYIKQHSLVPGRKCEGRSLGVRLGRNPYLISALSGLHHCHSWQGIHTDSWEICSSVQQDHDECKKITASYILIAVVNMWNEFAESVNGICSVLVFISHSWDYSVHIK